eukprot:874657-Amphidinium_carterae.1
MNEACCLTDVVPIQHCRKKTLMYCKGYHAFYQLCAGVSSLALSSTLRLNDALGLAENLRHISVAGDMLPHTTRRA